MRVLSQRALSLSAISLPLQVNHGHLGPSERIDDEGSRIDTLVCDVEVRYPAIPLIGRGLSGVFNYGKVYQSLCFPPLRRLTSPIETVLDEAIELIDTSAHEQGIALVSSKIVAKRMGLAVGIPQLVVERDHGPRLPFVSQNRIRRAGVVDYPLNLVVDHSWAVGEERVEHVDVRHETVKVSFEACTVAATLSDTTLGLPPISRTH